jgi:DNA-binding CsgD family transcriptional regulator
MGPTIRLGWPSARQEEAWRRYVAETPVERTPEYSRIAAFTGSQLTVTPERVWGNDKAWHRSPTFNERHRPAGLDDYIMSIAASPDGRIYNSVWLHRAVGEPAFGRRERWVVQFVHGEIGRLIGRALAAPDEPTFVGLSARHLRTLERLLAGDSEKIAAAELGLSVATVHEYVRDIYGHFGVRSRAELLARFVGRARPSLNGNGAACRTL